ncbi:hypothetical protein LIA77_10799 [Sarocladium implicatum]|nr:hypothetical protein LIA77_10799 [Sarocladium implicatum]
MEREPPTAEEGFEDVGLDDQKQQPRKRGFFAKFSDQQGQERAPSPQPAAMSRFLPGRKRGAGDVGRLRHPPRSTSALQKIFGLSQPRKGPAF